PESYDKGKVIKGIPPETTNSKVFHAGTSANNSDIVTSGGRVLCVVGLGDKVSDAHEVAYKIVHQIEWDSVFYRDDIGHRAIARE
ncbi:MAG: phosphoribosylglycinamide synthetase C domain-containing protein, partial [Cocleimonas sp.]